MPTNASIKQGLKLIDGDKSKTLGLSVANKPISTGEFVSKAEAQSAPNLSFAGPSQTTTYVAICVDVDPPAPSFSILGPILHWIQPGLKATDSSETLSSTDAPVASWVGPAPPPFSGPHRYVFFLYEQPPGFDGKHYATSDGKPMGLMARMRYDLDAFLKKAGLGEPVAVNYFKCN